MPQSTVLRNVNHSIKLSLAKPEQFNLNIIGIEVLIKTIKKRKIDLSLFYNNCLGLVKIYNQFRYLRYLNELLDQQNNHHHNNGL
jgi:hypothetical protein